MIGVDKPVYLEYDLPDADFVKNKQKKKRYESVWRRVLSVFHPLGGAYTRS